MLSMNNTTTDPQMVRRIRRFSDERLTKELAFAEGFDDPSPEAQAWLEALRAEATERRVLSRAW